MKQQFRRTALASLVMLMSATALVACGGGDDPAPAAAAPGGGGGSGPVAFATPASASATSQSGFVNPYTSTNGTYTPGTPAAGTSSVTMSGTLSGVPNNGYAAVAVEMTAPNNASMNPTTPATFNASSYTNALIELSSSDATSVDVKLLPTYANMPSRSPNGNDGCIPVATVTGITSTPTVKTVPLSAFAIPSWCSGAALGATTQTAAVVTPVLFAIGVANTSTANGTHDITVGTIKFQ